ncbi:MAG: hypothetical protein NC898_02570 [Candidatus Omnitrophica bacterium]|nr:hypothetical protein [Candidatus Omnitrophota bacterium]
MRKITLLIIMGIFLININGLSQVYSLGRENPVSLSTAHRRIRNPQDVQGIVVYAVKKINAQFKKGKVDLFKLSLMMEGELEMRFEADKRYKLEFLCPIFKDLEEKILAYVSFEGQLYKIILPVEGGLIKEKEVTISLTTWEEEIRLISETFEPRDLISDLGISPTPKNIYLERIFEKYFDQVYSSHWGSIPLLPGEDRFLDRFRYTVDYLIPITRGIYLLKEVNALNDETFPDLMEYGIFAYALDQPPAFHILYDFLKRGVITQEDIKRTTNIMKLMHKEDFNVSTLLPHLLNSAIEAKILHNINFYQVMEDLIDLGIFSQEELGDEDALFREVFPAFAQMGILDKNNYMEVGKQLVGLGKATIQEGFSADELFSTLTNLARYRILDLKSIDPVSRRLIDYAKSVKSLEGLRGNEIFRIFSMDFLAEKLKPYNFDLIFNTAMEFYRDQFSANEIFETFRKLINRGFNLKDILRGGKFFDLVMKFIRISGKNFKNNTSFFNLLTPGNIHQEIETVIGYFQFFETSNYLEALYEAYKGAPTREKKEELKANFERYFNNQSNGIKIKDPGLSPELIEEINFMVIGSTNLTRDKYRDILLGFKDKEIPTPNLKTGFTLNLNLSEITGTLTDEEKEYLEKRLNKLKEIVTTLPETYISNVISFFYKRFLEEKRVPKDKKELWKIIDILSKDSVIQEGIKNKDPKRIKERAEQLLKEIKFSRPKALEEIFDLFTEGDTPPSVGGMRELGKLEILRLYMTDLNIKANIDEAIELKDKIATSTNTLSAQEYYELITSLIEIFNEIKPQATNTLRSVIHWAVEMQRLEELGAKFLTREGKAVEKIKVIPAKTELDYFYGYFGENCTANYPEELLNPNFTPLRIITDYGIEGAVHTLTHDINGKKSLIIVGIEPKESLVLRLNPREFTEKILAELVNLAQREGYQQLLIATKDYAQSNRKPILEEIQRLIKDKPLLKQKIQPFFPTHSPYSIEELAIYWQR